MSCESCRQLEEEEEGTWQPDCDKCQLPVLLPESREAIRLYSLLSSNFVRDTGALELVMTAFKPKLTRRKLQGLIEKMILIHDILTEPRADEDNHARN